MDEFAGRLGRVRDAVAGLGWAGVVLPPGADLRYLTGYDALAMERELLADHP